VVRKAWLPLS